jgi:dipeptidyl-peptidase-4
MDNIAESMPDYDGRPIELSGFVWFHGWNDQYNGFERYYQTNMANFIRDVRKDLNTANLPFVIGGMGQGGDEPMYKSAIIRKAQANTAEMEEFKNNKVRYVPTAPYWREGKQGDGKYHYNGNAETFLLIGRAFGKAVLQMQPGAVSEDKTQLDTTSEKVEAVRFEPVVQNIEGWTVYVDPQMLEGEHSKDGADALKMLANHLQRIAVLMPEEQLISMRKLEIWIEHHHPTLKSMQYHPSIGWLKSHGHDARLAKKVHIPTAKSLLSRHQMIKHPAVVLHELAHAYHDQYFGFDDPGILKVYNKAKAAGIYEEVLLYTGKKVRHYGMTNQMEYFAEGTEAYFYRNDFYPFCRAELKEHDPDLHDLLEEIWGPLN